MRVQLMRAAGYHQGTGVRGSTQDVMPVDVLHRDCRSFGSRANGVVEGVVHGGLQVRFWGLGPGRQGEVEVEAKVEGEKFGLNGKET